MGRTFSEEANAEFARCRERLLGSEWKSPATVNKIKALGQLMDEQPFYKERALSTMEGRLNQASGLARQAFWKLALEHERPGNAALTHQALNLLFPHKPTAMDLYQLSHGMDGADRDQPWIQMRGWLAKAWPGQQKLRAATLEHFMHTAVYAAMIKEQPELLKALLDDIRKEPPVSQSLLLGRALEHWSIVAMTDNQTPGMTSTLNVLVEAGVDMEMPFQRKGATALEWLCGLSPASLSTVSAVNRAVGITALLGAGAQWRDIVDHEDCQDDARVFISRHPRVIRDRLLDAGEQSAPLLEASGQRLKL